MRKRGRYECCLSALLLQTNSFDLSTSLMTRESVRMKRRRKEGRRGGGGEGMKDEGGEDKGSLTDRHYTDPFILSSFSSYFS